MPPPNLPESAYEGLGLPAETVTILASASTLAPDEAASPNVFTAEPLPAGDLAPNTSAIALYAELLLNIRTVTLFSSLRTVRSRETMATLSSDGRAITVSHEGESATIRLPIKAKGGGNASLELPAEPAGKVLTLRLQIEELEGSELFSGVQAEGRKANLVPWDGASLNAMKGVKVLCKSCRSPLLAEGKVAEWRDLPNENWAEMMDFWHCHKPDEHHLHDHAQSENISKKGYSAATRLEAVAGIGFVDLTSLLLKEQDCDGVQLSTSEPPQAPHKSVVCKHCTHSLGIVDESASGHRLWKWSIDIISNATSPSKQPHPHPYNLQKWISARLLFLIENQGVRKFHVRPETLDNASTPSLLIWVFTPDLLFSSSVPSKTSTGRQDPTRAMKIFFQEQMWSVPKPGEPESASVEEVVFPREVFEGLGEALRESQGLLPGNARVFQGWEVGLLERFDVGEGEVDVPIGELSLEDR